MIFFIYDGWRAIEERAPVTAQTRTEIVRARYGFGNGLDAIAWMDRDSAAQGTIDKRYFVATDALGSVVTATTGSPVTVSERYTYSAYGKVTAWVGNWNATSGAYPAPGLPAPRIRLPYLFTGQRYDEETGLYYYKNRYYDPEAGRFLRRDLIGYSDGFNLYGYAGESPETAVDPLGLRRRQVNDGMMYTQVEMDRMNPDSDFGRMEDPHRGRAWMNWGKGVFSGKSGIASSRQGSGSDGNDLAGQGFGVGASAWAGMGGMAGMASWAASSLLDAIGDDGSPNDRVTVWASPPPLDPFGWAKSGLVFQGNAPTEWIVRTAELLDKLVSLHWRLKHAVKRLRTSGFLHTIRPGYPPRTVPKDEDAAQGGTGSGSDIYFDDPLAPGALATLAHEISHAEDIDAGRLDSPRYLGGVTDGLRPLSEIKAVRMQNIVLRAQGATIGNGIIEAYKSHWYYWPSIPVPDPRTYYCSVRTMYRLLADHGEVRERRDQLRHPSYQKPELLATAPNQVWSWDITKLLGPVKWTYYYLYVLLDIFSRYVVGWMVAFKEAAALAKRLIEESCRKQGIVAGQLTVHADRGTSMTSKPVALLLSDLGVTKTHSRPHVSNDNPYSEAQFKTLKYCPEFPDRFGGIEHARSFCHPFFTYYNTEHRHSGLGLMTPESIHYGYAEQILVARRDTLHAAYVAHPERFVRKLPQPPVLPTAAWINPPREKTTLQDALGSTIATSVDPRVPPVFVSEIPSSRLAAPPLPEGPALGEVLQ